MAIVSVIWTADSLIESAIFHDQGVWHALTWGVPGGAACGLLMGVVLKDKEDQDG